MLTDLELFGLQTHCVPVFKFCILLADKVIQNRHLVYALQLRFARCISALGYVQESKDIVNKILPQITMTPQDLAAKFDELNRMRVEFIFT